MFICHFPFISRNDSFFIVLVFFRQRRRWCVKFARPLALFTFSIIQVKRSFIFTYFPIFFFFLERSERAALTKRVHDNNNNNQMKNGYGNRSPSPSKRTKTTTVNQQKGETIQKDKKNNVNITAHTTHEVQNGI